MRAISVVLLAGGQSTRMGRDKALLPMPGTDRLLWQRQLGVLEELKPSEVLWSGAARPALPAHVRVVPDKIANAGPLAGIAASLEVMQGDLLVVLAIDLPRMTAAFLERLLARCSQHRGVVARNDEFFEPLAAVYSRGLRELAADHLKQKRHALQDFIQEAIRVDLMESVSLDESERTLFKNLNSPADLEKF
jgi:molybdopterin-guanine dinucleotide biosynthesis protein A